MSDILGLNCTRRDQMASVSYNFWAFLFFIYYKLKILDCEPEWDRQ